MIRCANSVLESQNIGYAQKAEAKTQKWPLKPKKPSPPFFQFLQEKRLEVTKKHGLKLPGIHVSLMYYTTVIILVYKCE